MPQGRVRDAPATPREKSKALWSQWELCHWNSTEQKTPNLNGSTFSALSVCSAPVLVGKYFIVPWKFITRHGVGGTRFVFASKGFLLPWGRERTEPAREIQKFTE